jgi:parallel beta-helix repeat protein
MKPWLPKLTRYLVAGVLLSALLGSIPPVVTASNRQVTRSGDHGSGTLRQALLDAQAGDTITFNSSVFPPGSPATISVLSELPKLTRNGVVIDASNAGVILDGAQAPGGANGLVIQASNCVVRGLTIQHFSGNGISIEAGSSGNTIGGDRGAGSGPNGQGNLIVANYANGIVLHNATGNFVRGNYVGIDSSGQWAMGNAFSGVALWDGASNNTIGGTTSGDRNVIGGNGHNGVWIGGIGANQNIVIGNYLGTRADGLGAVPNQQSGVSIPNGTQNNRIGGTGIGEGNLISGNTAYGIYIADPGTSGNQILGNLIGPNKLGTAIIGQGYDGVLITSGASQNTIGNGSAAGRNIISGNGYDGVHIDGSTTATNTVQSNYIGTNLSGTTALPNGAHGVELSQSAHNNLIGGDRGLGQGNLLSGNQNHGLEITTGAHHNTALGNLIGSDASGSYSLGYQPYGGIDIADGAHHNLIGDLTSGAGNLIGGNATDGIALFDNTTNGTNDNQILGNLIGLTLDGAKALPNGGPGVFDMFGAARTRIEGNTISGNQGDGVQLSDGSSISATVVANRIGTDLTGTLPIPNARYGVQISEGAHGHLVENNTISGNALGGVVLTNSGGAAPYGNTLSNNRMGVDSGGLPLGNGGPGVSILETASNNVVGPDNTIAFNSGDGIKVESCNGNTLTQNSIYSNSLAGLDSNCGPIPAITVVSLGASETISGTTAVANAHVEIFVDDADEGRQYVGSATADASGVFTFTQPGGFPGPNVTATSTDVSGNTSTFTPPAHLLWTLLLYFNGDNDLDEAMRDTFDNLVAAGPSPHANVLILYDGYTNTVIYSGTMLYDVTRGQATSITATLGLTRTVPGELDMGDGSTLSDFVTWGRAHYPARHTLLSIVDHGGGWAPSTSNEVEAPGALRHHHLWLAGGSGLSWDFTNGYDYLDSTEIRQAMATISNNGADKLDVVFYDVCLMGMIEVAYQIKDDASYFVSSQNIGWAPTGPDNRYVRTVHGIGPAATPRQMADLLVQSYADSMPPEGHPFTVSAIDLTVLPAVTSAVNQLGTTISQTLTNPQQAVPLQAAYTETQKVDYDADLRIEPATDGFVDLYDFARHASQHYSDPAILAASNAVTTALNLAVVAEQHLSASPWMIPTEAWNLDNVHGLSIFLPLGEDLELPIVITETDPISPSLVVTRDLRLRDTYTGDQLQFVSSTVWGGLINTYYHAVSSPVPTDTTGGPVGTLLTPDFTPPQTVITSTGAFTVGQAITITWGTTDTQSGLGSTTLWYQSPAGQWTTVMTQTGDSGVFPFSWPANCESRLAVLSTDKAGNSEAPGSANAINVKVQICERVYLPIVRQR